MKLEYELRSSKGTLRGVFSSMVHTYLVNRMNGHLATKRFVDGTTAQIMVVDDDFKFEMPSIGVTIYIWKGDYFKLKTW